ncbi:hypothetical protein I350_03008 [Cryptococcus amylolentus CBS 6273]|uniref:NAD-dependent epimerase/dehydratase domain-containing protein n=1 Tax=Cryptococcus amylolentus CBS 6273 TaxID=1296118 RepID=A0A1E3K885_9TREE|nr:hypothetical protein I350_03008 [Cryptococcus amylolentus CBS 6273]
MAIPFSPSPGPTRLQEAALTNQGFTVIRGALEDTHILAKAAADGDAVVHLAYNNDFTQCAESAQIDVAAINAMATAMIGTNKPLVITSVIPISSLLSYPAASRFGSEKALSQYTSQSVRTCVIRLPLVVHGSGDFFGIVGDVVRSVRVNEVGAWAGDGENKWGAVEVKDIAELYRLVLESDTLEAGIVLDGLAELVPFRDIVTVISNRLEVPTKSIEAKEMAEYYQWPLGQVTECAAKGNNELTKQLTGWKVKGRGLLDDLQYSQTYFK